MSLFLQEYDGWQALQKCAFIEGGEAEVGLAELGKANKKQRNA